MIALFQNVLFSKEFLACNGCFGLFSWIKKESGASFWCTFFAWFFHKNFPYLIPYQWTKFRCHTLFLSNKMCYEVLILTVNDVINFNIFLGSTSKAMADREKKERKMKIQKYEYLENENSFLDEIINIFHSF